MICVLSVVWPRPTAWPSSCSAKVYQELAPLERALTDAFSATTPLTMWVAPVAGRAQIVWSMPTRLTGWLASSVDSVGVDQPTSSGRKPVAAVCVSRYAPVGTDALLPSYEK